MTDPVPYTFLISTQLRPGIDHQVIRTQLSEAAAKLTGVVDVTALRVIPDAPGTPVILPVQVHDPALAERLCAAEESLARARCYLGNAVQALRTDLQQNLKLLEFAHALQSVQQHADRAHQAIDEVVAFVDSFNRIADLQWENRRAQDKARAAQESGV